MQGPRLTYRDAKLAILSILGEDGSGAKHALLGDEEQPGLLARHFGRNLTVHERSVADDAFQELRREGLIASSFREPENRVEITDAGRGAAETGCLDALDRALFEISPHLVGLRAAAWFAVAAEDDAVLSDAARGPREIVDAVVATAAATASLSAIAQSACDLALAVDEKIAALLDSGQVPSTQDVADAVRVSEIVVRALLVEGKPAERGAGE